MKAATSARKRRQHEEEGAAGHERRRAYGRPKAPAMRAPMRMSPGREPCGASALVALSDRRFDHGDGAGLPVEQPLADLDEAPVAAGQAP